VHKTLKRNIKIVFFSLLCTLIILVAFQSTEIFAPLITRCHFHPLSSFFPGFECTYTPPRDEILYLSYGLVRGECDAIVNGVTADTSKSFSQTGEKTTLLIGHEVSAKAGATLSLMLKCENQLGFKTTFAHEPILTTQKYGKLIQFIRAITGIFIGPAFALFLIIVSGINFIFNRRNNSSAPLFLIYAVCTFIYLISTAQITRLWLDGPNATKLHIMSYICASGSLLLLLSKFGNLRNLSFLGWITFSSATPYLFFDFTKRTFFSFYKVNSISILLISTILLIANIKKPKLRQNETLSVIILVAFIISQVADTYSLQTFSRSYCIPIVVAILCLVFIFAIFSDLNRLQLMDLAINRIIKSSKTKISPQQLLTELGETCLEFTKFSRVSCYVDAFLLGQAPAPKQTLLRVHENGYQKNTFIDQSIHLAESRGLIMKSALESQAIQKGRGIDGGYFAVLPLGENIVINLSDDHEVSEQQYQLSLETVEKLRPGIESVTQKINELSTIGGNLFQRLQSQFSAGQFNTLTTGFMLDIHDYSAQCARYKVGSDDVYSRFVSRIYLPALARTIAGIAYPEKLEGDLIALVCFERLFNTTNQYHESVLAILQTLKDFQSNVGTELCIRNGFEPIQFSIACSESDSSVTIDEIQCRTAGDALTFARRILDACPRNSIAIDHVMLAELNSQSITVKANHSVFVKKDLVEFSTVTLNSAGKNAA